MKKRGQFSMEYLLIGVIVIFLLVGSVLLYTYFSKPAKEKVDIASAESVLNTLVQAAEDNYALSGGTQTAVSVRMPSNVLELTFSEKEVFMKVDKGGGETADLVASSEVSFIERTFINPPEGMLDLYLGSLDVDATLSLCCLATE